MDHSYIYLEIVLAFLSIWSIYIYQGSIKKQINPFNLTPTPGFAPSTTIRNHLMHHTSALPQTLDPQNQPQPLQQSTKDNHNQHPQNMWIKADQFKFEDNLPSSMSVVSIPKEQSLSGHSYKPKYVPQQYAAFQEVDQYQDFPIAKILELNPQPTAKQIKAGINVLQIEFEAHTKAILEQLYRKVLNNSLPKLVDNQSRMSCKQKPSEESKVQKEQSEVSLVSVQDKQKPHYVLAELRSKIKKNKVTKKPNQNKKYQKNRHPEERSDQMPRLKRREERIDQELQILLNTNQGKQKPSSSNRHIDYELQDFFEQVEQKKVSDSVKIYVSKPSFITEEQRTRYTEKRIVAKSFIRRGYGLNSLRRELTETNCTYRFDEARYKTICYGMATETFRKLQQFIEQHMPSFVSKMQKIDIRLIAPYLLNCRDNFPSQTPTFIKMMQLTYNVDASSVVISKKEGIKLYQKIQAQYQSREDYREKGDSRFMGADYNRPIYRSNRHDVVQFSREEEWPQQNQIELMEFYIQNPNVAAVRDSYRQKYGPGSVHDDCKQIKSKLNKTIRAAIRNLKAVCTQYRQLSNYGSLISSLNNNRIKRILISPDAVEARVGLCRFSLLKSWSVSGSIQVMEKIERCLELIQGKRADYGQYDDFQF